MRSPRLTYIGAFHHCTARGIGGLDIFPKPAEKNHVIRLLQEKVRRHKIRLLAFCIMDNHYHFILQNTSGRLSEFFRSLNSQYAAWFQWKRNGSGYVFQGRFHSTLIQEGEYFETAILYTLTNPVRAGLVKRCEHYPWSSASLYGKPETEGWLDSSFVLNMFGDLDGLLKAAERFTDSGLETRKTPLGYIMGDEDFVKIAVDKFDRRSTPDPVQHRRRDDFCLLPREQVVQEFENSRGIQINQLNTHTLEGKKMRAELLVLLRMHAGLSFKQISEMDLYSDLQYKSLPMLFKRWVSRVKGR